jgi:hypothetical protein
VIWCSAPPDEELCGVIVLVRSGEAHEDDRTVCTRHRGVRGCREGRERDHGGSDHEPVNVIDASHAASVATRGARRIGAHMEPTQGAP